MGDGTIGPEKPPVRLVLPTKPANDSADPDSEHAIVHTPVPNNGPIHSINSNTFQLISSQPIPDTASNRSAQRNFQAAIAGALLKDKHIYPLLRQALTKLQQADPAKAPGFHVLVATLNDSAGTDSETTLQRILPQKLIDRVKAVIPIIVKAIRSQNEQFTIVEEEVANRFPARYAAAAICYLEKNPPPPWHKKITIPVFLAASLLLTSVGGGGVYYLLGLQGKKAEALAEAERKKIEAEQKAAEEKAIKDRDTKHIERLQAELRATIDPAKIQEILNEIKKLQGVQKPLTAEQINKIIDARVKELANKTKQPTAPKTIPFAWKDASELGNPVTYDKFEKKGSNTFYAYTAWTAAHETNQTALINLTANDHKSKILQTIVSSIHELQFNGKNTNIWGTISVIPSTTAELNNGITYTGPSGKTVDGKIRATVNIAIADTFLEKLAAPNLTETSKLELLTELATSIATAFHGQKFNGPKTFKSGATPVNFTFDLRTSTHLPHDIKELAHRLNMNFPRN